MRIIDAITKFLHARAKADLASLYSWDMECQVNAAPDGGKRVEGKFKGGRWNAWTDGRTTWKSFRIPWCANIDPTFDVNKQITWNLSEHCECIGLTGWNWKTKQTQISTLSAVSLILKKHLIKQLGRP